MDGVVQAVEAKINKDCCVQEISKNRCRVGLADIQQQYILIDMDHEDAPPPVDRKKCDYLFFGKVQEHDHVWTMSLELKRGGLKCQQVVEQLQAGAKLIDRMIASDLDFQFVPVVASGRIHKQDSRFFDTNQIKLRGRSYIVRRIRCGSELKEALAAKRRAKRR